MFLMNGGNPVWIIQDNSTTPPTNTSEETAFLPEPSRCPTGAWELPISRFDQVKSLHLEDRTRTKAQCWALAGAFWHPNQYTVNEEDHHTTISYLDPLKTKVEPHEHGINLQGGWSVTMAEGKEAVMMKLSHPDWDWGKCLKEAGGDWDIWHHDFLLHDMIPSEPNWNPFWFVIRPDGNRWDFSYDGW